MIMMHCRMPINDEYAVKGYETYAVRGIRQHLQDLDSIVFERAVED